MRKKLYKAIVKSVTGRFSTYIIQFASLAIYARLFSPQEFGVIASIHVFVIFFQMLSNIGIGPAIINEETFGNNKRDGIFTVTVITGVILAIVFFFFSYSLNVFYHGYEYQKIAVFVCITIFFSSLNIVPTTAMSKDAKFIQLAFVDIFAECLSLAIVYMLYLKGIGLLALATRPAIQSATRFSLTWIVSSKTSLGRPVIGKELYHIKSILSFSLYQFGFNFINYFSRNLDNILIAKYFGMASVGIYDKSYQFMRYPLMMTTFAMAPAIQPILTKYRNDKKKIVIEHNLLTARLLAISIPISLFIYVNSYNIVLFLFGEMWLGVEPLIKIFSFMIPIQSVLSSSGSFFQVMNKPRFLFISGFVAAVVSVSAIAVGIILGEMKYVASALVIAFSINFFQIYFVLFRYCFLESPLNFYLRLSKVIVWMLPPCLIFFAVNSIILSRHDYPILIDLFLNGVCGLISLVIFFVPIKKAIS